MWEVRLTCGRGGYLSSAGRKEEEDRGLETSLMRELRRDSLTPNIALQLKLAMLCNRWWTHDI